MVTHERDGNDETRFYPVDGIRGHCECGGYFHYISVEGFVECDDCGEEYNVYVDFEKTEEM